MTSSFSTVSEFGRLIVVLEKNGVAVKIPFEELINLTFVQDFILAFCNSILQSFQAEGLGQPADAAASAEGAIRAKTALGMRRYVQALEARRSRIDNPNARFAIRRHDVGLQTFIEVAAEGVKLLFEFDEWKDLKLVEFVLTDTLLEVGRLGGLPAFRN